MMEETYRDLEDGLTSKDSNKLLNHFNEKSFSSTSEVKNIEGLFKESSTLFYKFELNDKTGCFQIKDLKLDFPKNWSVFNNVEMIVKNKLSLILGVNEFDQSMLFQVMKKFCEYDAKIYIIASAEGAYLTFPRIENINFEEILNNYFKVNDQEQEQVELELSEIAPAA